MDQVNTLLNPPTQEVQLVRQQSQESAAKKFCCSRLGVAILSSIVFYLVLFILRPPFVMQGDKNDEFSKHSFNNGSAIALSLAGGAAVFFIPKLLGNHN